MKNIPVDLVSLHVPDCQEVRCTMTDSHVFYYICGNDVSFDARRLLDSINYSFMLKPEKCVNDIRILFYNSYNNKLRKLLVTDDKIFSVNVILDTQYRVDEPQKVTMHKNSGILTVECSANDYTNLKNFDLPISKDFETWCQ